MTDAELRGRLLSHFHILRDSNRGIVPVTEEIFNEPVRREAIARVCRELADVGLIQWSANLPGHIIDSAIITTRGVVAVERGKSESIDIRFPDKGARITTAALKEPERINLAEGLAVLVNYLPAADAKVRLRDAFVRKAFSQWPCFALSYDEAEIDWTTGAVKIPRKREPFIPTFSRAELNAYFLQTPPDALEASSKHTKAVLPAPTKTPSGETDSPPQRELLTLKPTFWGMSIDLKELIRRALAWWKARL